MLRVLGANIMYRGFAPRSAPNITILYKCPTLGANITYLDRAPRSMRQILLIVGLRHVLRQILLKWNCVPRLDAPNTINSRD